MKSEGLSAVPTAVLERLLRAVHRQQLGFPVTRSNLIAAAFGHVEQHLDLLIGLDQTAAQRVIVAVLAERRPRRPHG
jgi:hypothetical protein